MSRLEDLRTLRGQLVEWVEDAPIDRKAALVAQLRATLEEIEKLEPPKVNAGDPVDEITARRAARQSGAAKAANRSKRSG